MKKNIPIFLATMISIVLYSRQELAADLKSQCMFNIPSYNRPVVQGEINQLPITITADNTEGNYPNNATFTGNVSINHGNSRLRADKVQLLRKKQSDGAMELVSTVNALGNVYYDDNQIIIKGQKAWLNLDTKDTNVWKGDYQMIGHQGRGKAELIKQRSKNRYTILEKGSFTSCSTGYNTWSVSGSKVIHDQKKQIAEIWNARFKIGTVPIFYSPYLQLPTGNKRHSGFLIPNAKFNFMNYFELYLPYYISIAPNIDITVTPHYIHKIHKYSNCKRSSIMWESEFRYLTQAGTGLIEFYYLLPSDKVFEDEHINNEGNYRRWMYYYQHSGLINRVWRLDINYTKVSDPYYFSDFSPKYGSSTNNYATQMLSFGYSTQHFAATASSRQFQVFNDRIINNSNTYGSKLQLDINWYPNNIGPFNIRSYGQAVSFVSTNSNMPKAMRFHFEPDINLSWSNNWLNLDAQMKLMTTHYQQKNLSNYNTTNKADHLERSVNRMLPQFKIDGKLIFERDMNLAIGYTQKVEPRIQYLYVPYRDHSKINKYDSSPLQFDYGGLFRDRTYSGLDRIASANQIITGVTSRIIDNNTIERFNISIGQVYYFNEPRTGDYNIYQGNNNKNGSLIWVGDTYWHMNNRWGLHSDIQYNTRLDNVSTSSASAEYRRDEERMVQLTYRYASPKYIQEILPNYGTVANQHNHGISQVGGVASWFIANRWSVGWAYYFDTNTRKAGNQRLWLQYNSCCYAIRVGYERKINVWNTNVNQSKYDNIIGFKIDFRGLSSNYDLSI